MILPRTARPLLAALSTSLLLISTTAGAQTPSWFGEEADGTWYLGMKYSSVKYGPNENFDNAGNIEVVGGYTFSRSIAGDGEGAFELEIGGTVNDGEIRDSGGVDWDANTIGGYFAYRTPGDVYAKGRLGILHSNIDVSVQSPSISDTHFSYGAGLGVRLENFNIEVEYTGMLGDHDLSRFSVGGFYNF